MFTSPKNSGQASRRVGSPDSHIEPSAERFLSDNTLNFETLRKEFIGNPKLPGLSELVNTKNK